MRILKIRFANLNSLTGNWEIDLTHPVFLSDGIFAITGPTGSGKSTILDAVCLALYGRTPRLNRITKSSNEIMSRQKGECFAEITFETSNGVFRCHWSQHRARKKPDGELQAPKHEITDAVTGNIIETRLRDISGHIESITGMDFDQFTRSMLLAQGGFAAFLQADSDQRAPILEQITGTDIYSRISVRVHEIRSSEQKKLDLLESELSGLQLLSEKDEVSLQLSLKQKHTEEVTVSKQVKIKTDAIQWLNTLSNLEKDLENFQKEKQDLDKQQEHFKPEQEKLELAHKALEISGEFARLILLRKNQKTDTESYNKLIRSVPDYQLKAEATKKNLDDNLRCLEKLKNNLKEELKIIQIVRELDLKISEKEDPLKTLKDNFNSQNLSLSELEKKKNCNSSSLDQSLSSLENICQLLERSTPDENIVENLAGIQTRLDHFIEINTRYKEIIEEILKAENQKTKDIENWESKKERFEQKQIEIKKIKGDLNQKLESRKKRLEGKDITYWRNTLLELNDRKTVFDKIRQSTQSVANQETEINNLNEICKELTARKEIISEQIKNENEKNLLLEREKKHLETNLHLLNRILSFEEARKKLTDGEQCPLCGSREHPFAKENIPASDKTETELKTVNDSLIQSRSRLSDLIINQTKTSKDLEQNKIQIKECTKKLENEHNQIIELCNSLKTCFSDSGFENSIDSLYEENQSRIEHISNIVQSSEKYENSIQIIRDTLEKKLDELAETEQKSREAFHKKELSIQTLERLNNDSSISGSRLKKVHEELLSEISPLGIKELSIENIENIRNELISRKNRRLDLQKKKSDLQNNISSLKLQIEHQSERIDIIHTELLKIKEKLQALEKEKNDLIIERKKLYGDKDVNEEQTAMEKAIKTAEDESEKLRHIHINITGEFEKLKTSIKNLQETISERKLQIDSAEKDFSEHLAKSGFRGEDSYIEACLPEIERNELINKSRTLESRRTSLETRIRDKIAMLENENKKQITSEPLDKLTVELYALSCQLKTIQQEIGGISQRLTDNNDARS
ncbi:MAG TPA: AAA family ATPase, partial [Chitinispirillaceae bacterium]|nr:AAA family ATPase [Chitinispirillaceae bacterium]